jgi:hypothetical protein
VVFAGGQAAGALLWGQHRGRLTGSDERAEERATALALGEPEVTHLLPADNRH